MVGPNPQQEKLIESVDGIYLADAGPGTGKTYTIALRYAHIIENRGVEPDDILLITFTTNAAENMKERIINKCSYDPAALRDAPILTFHSLCNQILRQHGFEAPRIIGIDDHITPSTRILENEILEKQEFHRYMQQFITDHPEYNQYYRVLQNYEDLLGLIKSLAAKGIFPTQDGWFRNSEQYLDGDYTEFKELFDEANEPQPGKRGPKQSKLRSRLNGYKNKCFPPTAPAYDELRPGGMKQIPERFAKEAFEEDREDLKQFIHDIYHGYIEYTLGRNYLNFSFMMMLAYALLCENHSLRRELQYEYVMIDEFQDTNEIQFKLALLLSTGNLCVVGDWKQSIFAFQYASVDNIIQFQKRLQKYKAELNEDHPRIDYPTSPVHTIPLQENYRSTQQVIDFSEQALTLPATKNDEVNTEETRDRITSLEAVANNGPTQIKAYTSEDQKQAILWKITQLVNNPEYTIEKDGQSRQLQYGDIAVLSRTRKFGLELHTLAEEHGVPVAYEGGIELFTTPPALILLAWLRILTDKNSKRGWAVILEDTGYTLDETRHILNNKEYPEDMLRFREDLQDLDSVGAIARTIFNRYGLHGPVADRVIEALQSTYDQSYMNLGDLVNFIEANINAGETYDVDSTRDDDAFTIQTIHKAKGLEYPVVILPDITPRSHGYGGAIEYREPLGLRQNKVYAEEPHSYTYDRWQAYVMGRCLTGDYDEERRLLYVAMTRAENYLFITADTGNTSEFFDNLSINPVEVEPEISPPTVATGQRRELLVEEPETPAPVKFSCHALIDDSCFADGEGEGLGPEYGLKVHRFAEQYARGQDVEPGTRDEENVKRFIDSLEGEVTCEETCLLPVDVDGRRVLFEGRIDLVHVEEDRVEVIDFKTDRSRAAEEEYAKQMSLYYHVLKGVYRGREIVPYLFYTGIDTLVRVSIIDIDAVKQQALNILHIS